MAIRAAMIAALAILLAWGLVPLEEAVASDDGSGENISQNYGVYYGDGLRHLAERRYDSALKALFRAYGMEPSAHVLELIVESYDAMGDCEAVDRQLQLLKERHDEEGPSLTRCEETGEVVITCGDHPGEYVEVDGRRRGRCGSAISLAAEQTHYIQLSEAVDGEYVSVEAGAREVMGLDSMSDSAVVEQLSESVAQVRRLPVGISEGIDIPRLPTPRRVGYRIQEAEDGLYHILSGEDDDGVVGGAQVEMICPDDASDQAQCVWVRERDSGDGDGQSYEIYVPRLP